MSHGITNFVIMSMTISEDYQENRSDLLYIPCKEKRTSSTSTQFALAKTSKVACTSVDR